jgi:hypothetical protein
VPPLRGRVRYLRRFEGEGPALFRALHGAQVAVKGLLQAAKAAQAVHEHADYLRGCPRFPAASRSATAWRACRSARVVPQAYAGPGDVPVSPGPLEVSPASVAIVSANAGGLGQAQGAPFGTMRVNSLVITLLVLREFRRYGIQQEPVELAGCASPSRRVIRPG